MWHVYLKKKIKKIFFDVVISFLESSNFNLSENVWHDMHVRKSEKKWFKKHKYIKKRVYRVLKVSHPLGGRNITKVIKGQNVRIRFN